jgi:hypothetical protein
MSNPPSATWRVLIIDNFHMHDADEHYEIGGFPSLEAAREYCRRFNHASLEHCRKPSMSAEDLVKQWLSFGEAASVIGDPEPMASVDMVRSFAAGPPPTDPSLLDYKALEPPR